MPEIPFEEFFAKKIQDDSARMPLQIPVARRAGNPKLTDKCRDDLRLGPWYYVIDKRGPVSIVQEIMDARTGAYITKVKVQISRTYSVAAVNRAHRAARILSQRELVQPHFCYALTRRDVPEVAATLLETLLSEYKIPTPGHGYIP